MHKKTVLFLIISFIAIMLYACQLSNISQRFFEILRPENSIETLVYSTDAIKPTPTFALEPTPSEARTIDYEDTSIYRGSLERLGVYQGPGPRSTPNLLWTFEAGDSIYSSPAIYEGIAYFGSHNGNFYALDELTGEVVWIFQTDGMVLCSPMISNMTLYFGSDDGYLYALDVKTGKEIWRFKTGDWVSSSPLLSNGMVIFGSYDGFLYALDAQTGKELWRFEVAGINNPDEGLHKGIGASPAIAEGKVFIGSEQIGGASRELFFYGVDVLTGEESWEFSSWNIITSPTISDGIVYFGGFGMFYGLDGKSGSIVLEFSTDIITTAPAIYDGIAYFGTEDGAVHALDVNSNDEIWSFNTGGFIWIPPSISNDVLYIGTSSGVIYALDYRTGERLWDYQTNEKISTALVISHNVIYFGTDDGHLLAIGGEN